MADGEQLKEFPDVTHKLAAPKKLSAFEKERQAQLAKQKREEAENAAVLREFENSFAVEEPSDDDDYRPHRQTPPPQSGFRGGRGGYGGRGGRYGGPPGPRSGPGGLGPMPPLGVKRKRAIDVAQENDMMQHSRRQPGMPTPENIRREPRGISQALVEDEDEEKAAPRPTIQLASLPPTTTQKDIEALLKGHLKVHEVQVAAPRDEEQDARRSTSAIVTLESETQNASIDATVSALRDKYLGCGFYLTISRHLSSAAMQPSLSATTMTHSSEPFGAEKSRDQRARFSMHNAPPPMDQREFAPPASYGSHGRPGPAYRDQADATLSVRPPLTIETIKAVHTVAERLLLKSNPQHALNMEALLMAKPEVQQDERFAFLYDSRSPAGIYYRFLLWAPEHSDESVRELKRRLCGPERIFADVAIDWLPPYALLPFPEIKRLEDAVTDMDYHSSDEESDDSNNGQDRKFTYGREGDSGPSDLIEKRHLTPLKSARLVHLLSRLPTSNAKLRKGDVARVTNFAITNAGAGADEIVDLLLLNVDKPFTFSLAAKYDNPAEQQQAPQQQDGDSDEYEPDEELSTLADSPATVAAAAAASSQLQTQTKHETRRAGADEDPANAKLIALYLISDILSASSTAGARNAWKYRSLFEQGLRHQQIFPRLGKLERELEWGRLKAEQWKRRVGALLQIWEGWSVFGAEVLEEFKKGFLEPVGDEGFKGKGGEAMEESKTEMKWMGKFKRVEMVGEATGVTPDAPVAPIEEDDGAVDGKPMDDVDGTPMDEDVDGKPMDEDLDGMPMDDVDGTPMDDDIDGSPMMAIDVTINDKASGTNTTDNKSSGTKSETGKVGLSISAATAAANGKAAAAGPKRRMRAEDMFADSDED